MFLFKLNAQAPLESLTRFSHKNNKVINICYGKHSLLQVSSNLCYIGRKVWNFKTHKETQNADFVLSVRLFIKC